LEKEKALSKINLFLLHISLIQKKEVFLVAINMGMRKIHLLEEEEII
jgi:hypothetical protein